MLAAAYENKDIDPKNYDVIVAPIQVDFKETTARYIKVKAYNFGTLPDWHQGRGSEAFIFIDEITIK